MLENCRRVWTASRSGRRGFTLLELMVVVGIIALLFAILLPAIRHTREQAKMIQCANNMRQIMVAVRSYALDNREILPIPGDRRPDTGPQFAFSIVTQAIIDYRVGSLWRYIGGSVDSRFSLLNCPTDLEEMRVVNGANTVMVRNFSYSFHVQLKNGIRLTSLSHPGNKIILTEENWPNDSCAYLANNPIDPNDVPTNRHFGRGNEGFADGHVDSFFPVDLGFANNYSGISDPVLQDTYCNLLVP